MIKDRGQSMTSGLLLFFLAIASIVTYHNIICYIISKIKVLDFVSQMLIRRILRLLHKIGPGFLSEMYVVIMQTSGRSRFLGT